MIKSIVRAFVFSLLSVRITQYIMDGFEFGGGLRTYLLVIIGLTLLYFLLRPVLTVISLPTDGVGFLFLSFVLTLITLYVLTLFVSSFSVKATTISDLVIFGFVLPSKDLSSLWSSVFSALMLSIVFTFFDWLCSKR